MKRVLLVGNGAREQAIAEAFKRSAHAVELGVYASAVNPGIRPLAAEYQLGSLTDMESLARFAQTFKADFAFIGPDNPIADGAADALAIVGVPSVAPLKVLAQLESSKSFTRDLLKKYAIPGNPRFKVFTDENGLREWLEELGEYVVKADGLQGGKGVKLSGEHLGTLEEGLSYAMECIAQDGRVVVEEKFVGQEFSLMSFVDGKTVVDMPVVQDNKRAHEGDQGPNTGGMGTWSDTNHSLPFLNPSDLEEAHAITVAVMEALYKETGLHYKGIMYGGFIAVKNGVRLIEYNARFGDPESMNVLALLQTDFVDLCEAIMKQKLNQLKVEFAKKATVLKYVVPNGYPDTPIKGEEISLDPFPEGTHAYCASVTEQAGAWLLLGSRAIACLALGSSVEEAEILAEKAARCVHGPVFHRSDIGTKPLIEAKIDQMQKLRS